MSSSRTVERLVPVTKAHFEGAPQRRSASRAYAADERPELEPRGVGGILDMGWQILSSRFVACLGVAFAIVLPMRLLGLVLRQSGLPLLTAQLLEGVGAVIAQLLTAVLLANLVRDHLAGRPTSVGASVRAVLDRFGSLVGVLTVLSALQGCAVVVFACCFPLLYAVLWLLSCAPAVFAIEGLGVAESIARSFRIVAGWGNLGRFLGWYLVQSFMLLGLASVGGVLDEPTMRALVLEWLSIETFTLDIVAAIPVALMISVTTAYVAVLMTVYYFDVRVRVEGYDLELKLARKARELGAEREAAELAEAGVEVAS